MAKYTNPSTAKPPSINTKSENVETRENEVFLSEATLEVPSGANLAKQVSRPSVPHSTPPSEFLFEVKFQPIPRMDWNIFELELPVVRNKGVKKCIEEMSEFFQCFDYKYNYLQFWFLDVLTDCIWRAQDEFEFPEEQQRIILTWVLFFIDLIADPNRNYSHEQFFDVFKETILTAAEVLEEGSGEILLPLQLIKLSSENESVKHEMSTSTSNSSQLNSLSTENFQSYESVLEFEVGDETHRVVLDHEKCICSEFGESLPSSVSKLLEEQPRCASSNDEDIEEEDEAGEEIDDHWDYRDFYKPDTEIPSRFLPLSASEQLIEMLNKKDVRLSDLGSPSKLTFLPIGRSDTKTNQSCDKLTDYIIFRKERWQKSDDLECWEEEDQSDTTNKNEEETTNSQSDEKSEHTQHEKIMKGLTNFKLMEQRVKDFSDSNVGLDYWQMTSDSNDKSRISSAEMKVKANCFFDDELEEVLGKENLRKLEEQEFLSFGVLWAIIDFVYEYFSDSFQYTLIKMALQIQPNLIVQQLNDEWHVPKGLKEDLTLRVKDLKDKYKIIQRKVEKKPKEAKKPKIGDKKADKQKDKKSDKASKKKDDNTSKKTAKKGKGEKLELTEEELLARQQLEEIEAERIKQEMNKKFLFPLQDAIQDEFFKSQFPGWEKEELTNDKVQKPKKEKKKK